MTSARLPRTVVPSRYDIRIEPDLAAATFVGEETIEATVREATDEIVVNAADLTIRTVAVEQHGLGLTGSIELDEAAERAVLRFARPLQPGPCRLVLAFSGVLNDRLRGFYRSTFTGDDGRPRTLGVTQFEATDARRAFPCWDEPAFKAVFRLTLVVPEDLAAISNTAIADVRPLPDRAKKAVTFGPTIPMSTYLCAFVIGPLVPTVPVKAGGVPIRVWAAPGKGHLAGFALESPRSPCGSIRSITAYRTLGTSWISSPFPTLPSAPWKISGPSRFGRRPSWLTRAAPPIVSWRASPTWWRTRSPTCGSATS